MPITLDAQLGTNYISGGTTTVTLTTTSAVAAGGFIVLCVSCFGGSGTFLTSVADNGAGGSLSWTIDKQFTNDSNRSLAIVSAQAPSGLASGTVITATLNGTSAGGQMIGATSFLGVKTSSPVDGTPTGPTSVGTAAWATESYAIAAGSMLVGAYYSITVDAAAAHTAASPGVEAWERVQAGDNTGACMVYRIESGAGSYTAGGTWSGAGSTGGVNAAVAYLAAPAAAQHLAPSADSVDGAYTDQAAGTALAAAIDESSFSDTDYIQSANSPSAAGCRVKLASGTDPSSSSGHVIHWRIRKSSGDQTVNMTVKLYQGGGNSQGAGTLIATRDRNDITTSFQTFDETLTGTEADTITDYSDLYLEFYATAS